MTNYDMSTNVNSGKSRIKRIHSLINIAHDKTKLQELYTCCQNYGKLYLDKKLERIKNQHEISNLLQNHIVLKVC